MSMEQVAKTSHNDGNFGTIKRPRHLPDAGTFPDGEKVSVTDLSRPITFDLDGDLDLMARVVAELMAAPVTFNLSPSAVATKAAPGPDAKPSSRR